jgi:hypothetical protein
MPVFRFVRPVDAISIELPRLHSRYQAVPHMIGLVGEPNTESLNRESGSSNRHRSTPVAFSLNRAKFTPSGVTVAPSG